MMDAIIDADHDPMIAMIAITGAGDQAFCSGADLKADRDQFDMAKHIKGPLDHPERTLMEVILDTRKPVMAIVNGPAVAGGFELALACDLRVAATDARLGLPEASLGLLPAAGGTQRLTRMCGQGIAKRLILGAELVDGAEAERLGIVQWVRPPAELASWTRELAQRLAATPIAALTANKRCIAAAGDATRDGFAEEIAETRKLYEHPETRRKVSAFLARRATRPNRKEIP
jgi:enoyl-CoA hydratase/carnithine racemase